jgi:hypothetical protein
MPEHVHLLVDGPEGAVIKYRFANSWMGQERPSAAEAACIGGPRGTAEAVPFPSYPTKNLFRGAQPILQSQALDAGEFSFVVGDHHVTKRQRMRRNQQIICADWCAGLFESGTQQSVGRVRWSLEG